MKRSEFVASTATGLALTSGVGVVDAAAVKPDFVLVHGAFVDETAWAGVSPALQGAGAMVSLVALPGHSDADSAQAGRFTLTDYVAAVKTQLDSARGPVVLVGHSLGGVVITQVAENFPDRIACLVYLSAYLPENGKSILDYSDPESKLGPGLQIDKEHGVATISHETMQVAFFNNTPAAVAAEAQKHLRPEPIQPFGTPVQTTMSNFGRLPRYYITTLRDQAVGPTLQKAMFAAQPVRHVYTIDTDHSSYFSAPDQLSQALLDVRARLA
jgi:pimeloyl-ACP methyl ester carboxylesterase